MDTTDTKAAEPMSFAIRAKVFVPIFCCPAMRRVMKIWGNSVPFKLALLVAPGSDAFQIAHNLLSYYNEAVRFILFI